MAEWIPIILSFCLGCFLRFTGKRFIPVVLAGTGIALVATSAFVASGESSVSWTYLLLDLAETSLAFLVGNAARRAVRHKRNLRNAN